MDAAGLVQAALTAGATAGASELVKSAVSDAYRALRRLVARRLQGQPSAEAVVAEHAADPDTWRAPLEKALTEAGVDVDEDLVEAAKKLLALADPEGTRAGKYTLDLRGAQGVQVGDHNTQSNQFGQPPPAP